MLVVIIVDKNGVKVYVLFDLLDFLSLLDLKYGLMVCTTKNKNQVKE